MGEQAVAVEPTSDYKVEISKWLSLGTSNFEKNWKELVGFTAIVMIVTWLVQTLLQALILAPISEIFFQQVQTSTQTNSLPAIPLKAQALLWLVNLLMIVVNNLLTAFLMGGLIGSALSIMRNETIAFGGVFKKAVQYLPPLFFYFLFLNLLLFVFSIAGNLLSYAGLFPGMAPQVPTTPESFWATFLFVLVMFIIMFFIFLLVSPLYTYVSFHIVDKKRRGYCRCIINAFKGFYRHFFMNTVAVVLFSLIGGLGVLGCCIGLFATIPLSTLMFAAAYNDIYKEA